MINPAHDTPLSDKEIDDLDARLLDSSLDTPMDISMLDGFLCAVLSGPRLVPPSEWLPWVWDHEAAEQAPQFRSDKDAKHLAGLVMRFGNEIARGLTHEPEQFQPLFPESNAEHGSVSIIDDWCFGFLKGVALDAQGWQPLIDAHPEWFETINLYGTEEGWRTLEEEIEKLPDADARHQTCVAAIAPALRRIHAHWRAMRGPAGASLTAAMPPVRTAPKPGRNEPCPCGSGRKYKHCHGAAN